MRTLHLLKIARAFFLRLYILRKPEVLGARLLGKIEETVRSDTSVNSNISICFFFFLVFLSVLLILSTFADIYIYIDIFNQCVILFASWLYMLELAGPFLPTKRFPIFVVAAGIFSLSAEGNAFSNTARTSTQILFRRD